MIFTKHNIDMAVAVMNAIGGKEVMRLEGFKERTRTCRRCQEFFKTTLKGSHFCLECINSPRWKKEKYFVTEEKK